MEKKFSVHMSVLHTIVLGEENISHFTVDIDDPASIESFIEELGKLVQEVARKSIKWAKCWRFPDV